MPEGAQPPRCRFARMQSPCGVAGSRGQDELRRRICGPARPRLVQPARDDQADDPRDVGPAQFLGQRIRIEALGEERDLYGVPRPDAPFRPPVPPERRLRRRQQRARPGLTARSGCKRKPAGALASRTRAPTPGATAPPHCATSESPPRRRISRRSATPWRGRRVRRGASSRSPSDGAGRARSRSKDSPPPTAGSFWDI
jgi:hypothetical protein